MVRRWPLSWQVGSVCYPTMIHQWKHALLEGTAGVFECGGSNRPEIDEEQVKELLAEIGELAVANSFWERQLKPWGGRFTSFAWTDRLRRSGVRISMDGKGRFLPSHRLQANDCRAGGSIFIERLWRTLKYDCVYLHAWETGSETKAAIRIWMTF